MGGNCWSSGWLFSTVGLLLDDFWITFGWLLDYIWMTFGWLLDDFPDEGVTNSSPATGATPDPPVVDPPPLLFSPFPPTNYPPTTNVFAMLLLYQLSKTCIHQQYVVLSWQDNSCSQSNPILPWALGPPSSYSVTLVEHFNDEQNSSTFSGLLDCSNFLFVPILMSQPWRAQYFHFEVGGTRGATK